MIFRLLILAIFLMPITVYAAEEETADGIADWDVDQINDAVPEKGYTFKAGRSWVTKHLRRTKDITAITGYIGQAKSDNTDEEYIEPMQDLPSSWDWRERVEGGLQPVRNQGSCGSCWAFSTSAVLESLAIIADPKGPRHDLSEQHVLSCSRAGSCRGGYFTAFNMMKTGVGQEQDFPYRARDLACKKIEPKEKIVSWSYIKGKNGGEPSIEQLKTAIIQYGPLSVTVNAGFGSYKSGIYNRCSRGYTNHMVNLEGWDDSTESFLVRNSWGRQFGEEGYIRIKYLDKNGKKCNRLGEVAAFAIAE
jgi:C1A family cysteine protease